MCFFFKRNPAYERRISDWSSDVCSSDLHDVAISALGARQQGPQGLGILLRLAALQLLRPRRRQPGVLRRDLEALDLAPVQRRDAGRAGRGDLVEAVQAVDDPGAFRPQLAQPLRQWFDPFGGEDRKSVV